MSWTNFHGPEDVQASQVCIWLKTVLSRSYDKLYFISPAYLKEETTECVREITDLQNQCRTLASLSYAAYATGFKIVKVSLINRE